MLEPFATINDLEVRWKKLSEDELPIAEALLFDASAFIAEQLSCDYDVVEHANVLRMVTCNAVKRQLIAMDTESDSFAMTQFTQTAGVYSFTGAPANPTGDLYLTSNEKSLLGLNSCKVACIEPSIGWDQ